MRGIIKTSVSNSLSFFFPIAPQANNLYTLHTFLPPTPLLFRFLSTFLVKLGQFSCIFEQARGNFKKLLLFLFPLSLSFPLKRAIYFFLNIAIRVEV